MINRKSCPRSTAPDNACKPMSQVPPSPANAIMSMCSCLIFLFFCSVFIAASISELFVVFFQAEDGIRDAQEARGLGDVYKRQMMPLVGNWPPNISEASVGPSNGICLLYTSDAADEEDSVDLGGRRIVKKKK